MFATLVWHEYQHSLPMWAIILIGVHPYVIHEVKTLSLCSAALSSNGRTLPKLQETIYISLFSHWYSLNYHSFQISNSVLCLKKCIFFTKEKLFFLI